MTYPLRTIYIDMMYKCDHASESGFVCVSVGDAPATESLGGGPGGSQH